MRRIDNILAQRLETIDEADEAEELAAKGQKQEQKQKRNRRQKQKQNPRSASSGQEKDLHRSSVWRPLSAVADSYVRFMCEMSGAVGNLGYAPPNVIDPFMTCTPDRPPPVSSLNRHPLL
jgi:hypothetical protein